jgi:hypothetical protein
MHVETLSVKWSMLIGMVQKAPQTVQLEFLQTTHRPPLPPTKYLVNTCRLLAFRQFVKRIKEVLDEELSHRMPPPGLQF